MSRKLVGRRSIIRTKKARIDIEMNIKAKKLGKWFSNLWYHRKWTIIISVFLITILTLCIVQLVQKEEYDYRLIYAGPEYIEENAHREMTAAIEAISRQSEKNAGLIDVIIMSDEEIKARGEKAKEEDRAFFYDVSSRNTTIMQINTYLSTGEGIICFLDGYIYESLKEQNAFVPLSEILGDSVDNAFDEFSIQFKDLDFVKAYSVFSALPKDTHLCIRKMPVGFTSKGQKQAYKEHTELFGKLVSFGIN